MPTSSETSNDFAQKLDHLFRTVTKPDGTEYSYEEVQQGTGKAVTSAYIWRLRTGKATNPGYWVIKALSDFFQVNPDYFFQEGELNNEASDEMRANVKLAAQLQDERVKDIALRASELDDAGKQALLDMVNYIKELKNQRK